MNDIKHDPIANTCYHLAMQLGITDTEKRENFISWASKQAAGINELKEELAFQIRRNEANESSLSGKIQEVLRLTARVAELENDNARMREALRGLERLISDISLDINFNRPQLLKVISQALFNGEW